MINANASDENTLNAPVNSQSTSVKRGDILESFILSPQQFFALTIL